ncbi:MAG TPA: hypothetical protein VG734_24100 [Lacunisphaera sp.]|nr:hypothetical protein [Lacunisphaera sp.]
MITTTLKDTWGVIKNALRQKYSSLTDNDLAYILGEEEQIMQHIQEKTGASREELMHILRNECGCQC